jgi:ubiquinone/menaquinone biosynthesis C-methylase UbiE
MAADRPSRGPNDAASMPDETERWKTLDAASYDDVADQFAVSSERLSAGAARRLLELAAPKAGERILDVGTGAGLLPFALLQRGVDVGPVIGIDISSGMIAAARRKAREAAVDERLVRFEEMDAEQLAFGDASFDLVISAFALTHVPRPELALGEIRRVLRPGGRVAITLGSRPPLLSVDTLMHGIRDSRRRLQAMLGRRLTTDLLDRIVAEELGLAVDELPQGSRLSRDQNRATLLEDLVRQAGFRNVSRSWRNYQNEVATAEEFWNIHRTIRSESRKRLLHASPSVIARIQARFLDSCRRTVERGGVLAYPISAVFVMAERPD